MSWLFNSTCDSSDCDIRLVIGSSRDFYAGWMGYCNLCLKNVMLHEIWWNDPAYMPDVTIHRILNA